MARSLCHDVKTTREHLVVHCEVVIGGYQHTLRVRVPWKWIASTDAIEHIEKELTRRGRSRERAGRPFLPLESWE